MTFSVQTVTEGWDAAGDKIVSVVLAKHSAEPAKEPEVEVVFDQVVVDAPHLPMPSLVLVQRSVTRTDDRTAVHLQQADVAIAAREVAERWADDWFAGGE